MKKTYIQPLCEALSTQSAILAGSAFTINKKGNTYGSDAFGAKASAFYDDEDDED